MSWSLCGLDSNANDCLLGWDFNAARYTALLLLPARLKSSQVDNGALVGSKYIGFNTSFLIDGLNP
jgi:hypothetical protein